MNLIELDKLAMIGFRSFRRETSIEFPRNAGFRFITGENQIEPRLGPNGTGKSTIWDAFVWCLTGASIKGLRASSLRSWGAENIAVEVDLRINDELHTIERRGMPDRLLIDGVAVEQENVTRLIGLSRIRLLHSVIFGQGIRLFIALPGPERALLLDEVLDLGIWLKASEHAGIKHKQTAGDLIHIGESLAREEGKLEGIGDPDKIDAEIEKWNEEHELDYEALVEKIEECAAGETELRAKVAKIKAKTIPPVKELDAQIKTHIKVIASKEAAMLELDRQLKNLNDSFAFYASNGTCPECGQKITAKHARECQSDITADIDDRQKTLKGLAAQLETVNRVLIDLEKRSEERNTERTAIIHAQANAEADLRSAKKRFEELFEELDFLENEKNPFLAKKRKLRIERAIVEKSIKDLRHSQRVRRGELRQLDFWKQGFKRVRLFIVKRILAQLQIETQSAAASLGLIGWDIEFSTEIETNSGSIRPGIHILVRSPSSTQAVPWEVWSGGEGQRLQLAVAFGLASVIQRMAGVRFGFEVWDEPSSWLSQEGIDDLMECFKWRAQTHSKAVWLCDHRSLTQVPFDAIWKVIKSENGSEVYRIASDED